MLTAQAHSYSQQSRLAVTLSWIAGYTNILTVLTCAQVTSHMSGVASELGRDVAQGRWGLALYAGLLLAVFMLGAALSGAMTEFGRIRGWQSIYIWPIAVEAGLLAAFALLVEYHDAREPENGARLIAMTLLPAMAMGLQNATITRISGGIVRTTHVTGVITDLGLELAQIGVRTAMHKREAPRVHRHHVARLALLASIVAAFIVGAGLGAAMFGAYPEWSMVPPVLFLAWIIFQDIISPIAALERSKTIPSHGEAGLPENIALYRVRHHTGRQRRMPNLLSWVEHVSERVRVVVLDLHGLNSLDTNAALEVRALHLHLEAQGRSLVLAGVDPGLYACLEEERVIPEIEPLNVCSDLEIAISRAYVIIETVLDPPRPANGPADGSGGPGGPFRGPGGGMVPIREV